ncbi:Glutamate--cysteine ligase GshA [Streptomyces sp. YIM 130001]|uniref:ergothioneine biosynthesis glutamate--cysteine ligase EgtA n=1 Tax=Streptomyces sp. YIM 130001 TaxID=2259644 RepID=UPI000E65637C|nr:ergothioneine biosynthesis glutamate--cysteine ligase EgtA [Streptomyces sp. YIM 130001]RII20246.1 Glutamate--cysteine ligase GshA [Streptomyces sp. YIM 130001]
MQEADCPRRTPTVTEAEVEALVKGICFKTGPPHTLGVELEWHIRELHDPRLRVPPERHEAALAAVRALPLASPLTVEPGGQLELSSLPAPSLSSCVDLVSADLALLRSTLAGFGLGLSGIGQDPWLAPRRTLTAARYDAMEAYFDRTGPAGRAMMCSSASVQVCVDAGHEEPGPLGHGRRWRMAHLLGAVLVAAFANSPMAEGRRTGWRSTRQAVWAAIEPSRSAAPPYGAEPRAAWTEYVLDAPVMCLRTEHGPWQIPDRLTFRDWLRHGLPRPPTQDDLDYHLTTLFPPVRPRGHLELRMIDAQGGDDGWLVPLAVTDALFDDPEAAERAYRIVEPLGERAGPKPAPHNPLWLDAARHGLADPELHRAATACFAAATEALPRRGASRTVRDAVGAFTERYVARGRCPADDLLERIDGRRP